jgi:O-antigen/teichoic acid export membrane protein
MASWAAGGYGHARSAVSRAYLYQAIIGIPLLIVVFVGHRAVTTTLLGRVAVSGDLVTPWFLFVMMLAVMLFNLALVAQKGLELAERTPTLACLLAACIALNICLAILLAPHLGMLGVAYASVIATLVYFAASHTLSARFLVVAQRAAR